MPILDEAFTWAEALLKARLCVHAYQGGLGALVGGRWLRHHHPYCLSAKLFHSTHCLAFEQERVRAQLRARPEPFWKTCPAGALELVIPLRLGGLRVGALFAGPWKVDTAATRGRLPGPLALIGKPLPIKRGWVPPSLPALAPRQAHQAQLVLQLLAALLERELSGLARAPGSAGNRQQQITAFLEAHYDGPTSLGQLAKALGLSSSRTGKVVRELFHSSFPALLVSRRLELACHLLRQTALPVHQVASHAGFSDVRYFQRVFRRRFGTSARCWRLKTGTEGLES